MAPVVARLAGDLILGSVARGWLRDPRPALATATIAARCHAAAEQTCPGARCARGCSTSLGRVSTTNAAALSSTASAERVVEASAHDHVRAPARGPPPPSDLATGRNPPPAQSPTAWTRPRQGQAANVESDARRARAGAPSVRGQRRRTPPPPARRHRPRRPEPAPVATPQRPTGPATASHVGCLSLSTAADLPTRHGRRPCCPAASRQRDRWPGNRATARASPTGDPQRHDRARPSRRQTDHPATAGPAQRHRQRGRSASAAADRARSTPTVEASSAPAAGPVRQPFGCAAHAAARRTSVSLQPVSGGGRGLLGQPRRVCMGSGRWRENAGPVVLAVVPTAARRGEVGGSSSAGCRAVRGPVARQSACRSCRRVRAPESNRGRSVVATTAADPAQRPAPPSAAPRPVAPAPVVTPTRWCRAAST